jgi:hypothetical protein
MNAVLNPTHANLGGGPLCEKLRVLVRSSVVVHAVPNRVVQECAAARDGHDAIGSDLFEQGCFEQVGRPWPPLLPLPVLVTRQAPGTGARTRESDGALRRPLYGNFAKSTAIPPQPQGNAILADSIETHQLLAN